MTSGTEETPPPEPIANEPLDRWRRLSRRERRTLTDLAEGLTNREIAARHRVGVRTIDTFVAGLLHKLGVHNRAQAAVWYVEHRDELLEAGEPKML